MGQTFKVEADELGQLSKELGEATQSMGGAVHALEQTNPKVTGEAGPDMACEGFGHDWSYGLKQLTEALQAIGKGLDATARGYRRTDDVIRRTMSGQVAQAAS
ncbi:type VII secretion target [Kitasatospora sp. NBC_00240]|uniref:type VII secretion target n=1 Tax=Kitasatospora sp. NBC_00240 TaxID=2903567 RepID=UPI0022534DAF|nr:type VII secretion target [Kitasatospora sp. NBC_00240]MCX5208170.1 type VII secretion target [Kitasatospora sp. NBC_00240]